MTVNNELCVNALNAQMGEDEFLIKNRRLKMEHTPTPYQIGYKKSTGVYGANHIMTENEQEICTISGLPINWTLEEIKQETDTHTQEALANAQFIVHACNCHAELVEVCKTSSEIVSSLLVGFIMPEHRYAEMRRCLSVLQQALSKAELNG